jgi:hypothetical protein
LYLQLVLVSQAQPAQPAQQVQQVQQVLLPNQFQLQT